MLQFLSLFLFAVQSPEKVDIKLAEQTRRPGATILMEYSSSTETRVGLVGKDERDTDLTPAAESSRVVAFKETTIEAEDDGTPLKLKRQYLKAEATEKGKTTALTYQGKTVLIEKNDGKYRVRLEGGEDLQGADALGKEFDGEQKPVADFEKTLLPGRPVAVGETWQLNRKALIEAWGKDLGLAQVDEAAVKGTGRLLKVYQRDSRQFGVLKIEATVPLGAVDSEGKRQKLEAGSRMTVEMELDACIDGSRHDGTMKITSESRLAFSHADAADMRVVAHSRYTMTSSQRVLSGER